LFIAFGLLNLFKGGGEKLSSDGVELCSDVPILGKRV